MKRTKKVLALLAALAISAAAFAGCNQTNSNSSTESKASTASTASDTSADESKSDSDSGKITSEDDLKDKKLGVQNGTTGAIIAEDYIDPDKGGQVINFNTYSEAVLALNQNKIDCLIIDEQPAKAFAAKNEGLKIVDKELTDEDYAAVIAKSQPDLLESVNTALKELKDDGTLDKIVKSYIPDEGEEAGSYHYTQTVTDGEKLKLATSADFPPYEYHEGEGIVGIDIEIAYAIADKLGKVVEIQDMKFDSIIPAVDSGKADIGFSGFTVTDERKKQINFTETYAHSKQVMLVKE